MCLVQQIESNYMDGTVFYGTNCMDGTVAGNGMKT